MILRFDWRRHFKHILKRKGIRLWLRQDKWIFNEFLVSDGLLRTVHQAWPRARKVLEAIKHSLRSSGDLHFLFMARKKEDRKGWRDIRETKTGERKRAWVERLTAEKVEEREEKKLKRILWRRRKYGRGREPVSKGRQVGRRLKREEYGKGLRDNYERKENRGEKENLGEKVDG